MRTSEYRKQKSQRISLARKLNVVPGSFRPGYAQCPNCYAWMPLTFRQFYCPACMAPAKIFL